MKPNNRMYRRHYDKQPFGTSAGVKFQVSHWLAWFLAVLQAVADIVTGV